MRLRIDEHCFVCGPRNPAGLHVPFQVGPEGTATAAFTPTRAHQGYEGVTHGGILAALLDEAMVYAGSSAGGLAATAELSVRFRCPTPVGATVCIEGRVARRAGRLLECEAEVRTEDGEIVATAKGKLLRVAVRNA